MQSKKARRAARQVNLFLDPSLKEESDYVKKNGKRIPKKRREFSSVVERLDNEMKKSLQKQVPADISAVHYLSMKKIFEIAYRDNDLNKQVTCPKCKEKFNVELPHVKAEANSLTALSTLFDRMYPKLGHLTQEINLTGYMNVISESIVGIVVKYVPQEKKPEAMAKISEMFERLIENESGIRTAPVTEIEQDNMLESIA